MASNELPPRLTVDGPRLLKADGKTEWFGRGVSFGAFWEDQPTDAAPVAALGCNVARILLRWWMYSKDPGIDSRDNDAYAFIKRENIRQWLDCIQAASQAGMWVVAGIDSNCGQSGTQD